MTDYAAPRDDMTFVLRNVVGIGDVLGLPAYADFDFALIEIVIDEAAKLIEKTIAPTNRTGDEVGCVYANGTVTTPPGFRAAYEAWVDGGWPGLSLPAAFGGQGLPHAAGVAVSEMLCAANTAFSLYPVLTRGVIQALEKFGDDALKSVYLPPLAAGKWCGTMCLSEPQAGSDVGATRTRAIPQPDGSHRLEGSKIWITGGEHDLTEQIVHLVLARLPGAPEGTRGLTLFLVPKFLVGADRALGRRNAVRCERIEDKMGINGSATCVLAFDNAEAYRVGAENGGMAAMFAVMNYERFEVGLQGLGLAERATQQALRYATERRQGVPITLPKGQRSEPIPIIDHPDVRRMVTIMQAYTEGMRVLAYDMAKAFDMAAHHPDPAVREGAQDRVDLLIPVCKALFTDLGVEIANLGIQVMGGVGYVREYGMEQILRDARIGAIYEGTNGIQALDLVRRKLTLHGGRLWRVYFADIRRDLAGRPAESDLIPIEDALGAALAALERATERMADAALNRPLDAAAGAADFLRAFGLVALGHGWARAARAASVQDDAGLRTGKIRLARFYAGRMLGANLAALLANATVGAADLM